MSMREERKGVSNEEGRSDEEKVGSEDLLVAAGAVYGDLLPGGGVYDGDPLPLPGQGGGDVGGRRLLEREGTS